MHYKPLGPSDAVPTHPIAVAVALADKIDTLACFWVIDQKPTGSKDPYALRRAALGILRLILISKIGLKLVELLASALRRAEADKFLTAVISETDDVLILPITELGINVPILHSLESWHAQEPLETLINLNHGDVSIEERRKVAEDLRRKVLEGHPDETTDLLAFFHDRLKVYLKDQGIRHDVIDACLQMPGNDDLTLLVKRAEALAAFLKTDDGENLLQGFKRAANILSQAEEKDGVEYSYGADIKFAETDAERALFDALDRAEAAITPAMKAEDFATAMSAMAALRAPIDAFFTAVQVNTDNAVIRRNRLNLLSRIRTTCLAVADLTRLDG
jgi:glycyl-tRNA synthetase beta chain